jgi:prophage maintenance system killer protein
MENETAPSEAPILAPMKYLTVQDIIWINLQATKKVRHFNFARLEEATFYQYGYGGSKDLARQAGRFVSGFMKMRPFECGNEATAFIGLVAFLVLNDCMFSVSDAEAATWLGRVRSGSIRAEQEMPSLLERNTDGHHPLATNVRDSVRIVMERYPLTLIALGDGDSEAIAS